MMTLKLYSEYFFTTHKYFYKFYFPLPFCSEENVYLLCKTLCTNGMADAKGTDLFVVFISNEKKQACTMFSQTSCTIVF